MKATITDIYKGWTISVTAKDEQCSHFSFDITSPSGYSQHVSMGGIKEQRAVERASHLKYYINEFHGADIVCQKVCEKATSWDQTE